MTLKLAECRNHWALVTGASTGIGREFCIQLAAAGMNLIMVARREELLRKLETELAVRYKIQSLVLTIDLSKAAAAAEVRAQVDRTGLKIRLLCNNAAFGRWGAFEATPAKVYEEMIRLNTVTMVSICHHFLPDLASHATSAIINVSSPAAYQPVPYMAVYAATKSFVHSFSQALYGEWKDRGIVVQALVPGPTDTEFDVLAGAYASALKGRGSPVQVVRISLAHLERGDPLALSAKGTFKQRLFAGLFPPRIVINEVAKMFKRRD
jgi:hypothetical protein